ncbi:hypothetical protein TNCV_3324811 [Trichonephila clavipes]|nr:hypothetical protein TNCV_3324811 [Trichonephila clavipes]
MRCRILSVFDVAGFTIRPLVLVTPNAVDFDAGDCHGNYAGHFSVSLIKEESKVDLSSNLSVGIVLSWVLSLAKLRDR